MAKQGSYGVSIVVDGDVLPEIEKNGKTYLAAPSDRDFVVRITSPSYPRHEVVLSVDGLSVMTGEDASSADRGYIAEGRLDIPGFRLNDSEVAAFHFGKRNDSYANLLGKPKNVGVIAVKFFSEYQRRPVWRGGATSLSRGASRGSLGHDMGTEFGDRRDHQVSQVEFQRDREVVTLVIEYASTAQLRKAGILPAEPALGRVNAFPGDDNSGPGCKPPASWKGGKKKSVTRKKTTAAKKITAKKTATSARRRRR